jgi:DNA-binding transcriptional ArsR family regulator
VTDTMQLGFRALADPTRRSILLMLASKDMTIAEVATNFQMTRAAVKKHLTILDEGNLIIVRTHGRSRLNTLNPKGLKQVLDWFGFFDAFWDERLNSLKSEIEKDTL